MERRFIISLLVDNKFGVLQRISGMFSRRGFNIDSLTVGVTENPELSRMTVTMTGDEFARDQMIKQLSKLYDVRKIVEMTDTSSVQRELVIMKVSANSKSRQDIMDAANVFRTKVIDFSPESVTLEITGDKSKVDAFIEIMDNYGIIEMCRTGIIAMERGNKMLKHDND
ncbi:MAG: acetolactate synthase small subunit [Clostridia bacterium]|nr:acetolactate synthase small subunit [Clostridia bacterium]MEE1024661.1 acetolactate synthase small subunit [Acutalibacteraceae bacterium]